MAVTVTEEKKSIQEVLSLPILLTDRVIKSTHDSSSFKPENSDLSRQLTHLSSLLRSLARLTSTSALYHRPIRCVSAEVTKSLDRALIVSNKCRNKKTNVLRHVLSITTCQDFKKVSLLIDSSLADVKWVLSIYSQDYSDSILSLPPIASNDPMLAWVWSYLAQVQMGRAEAAHELANLARGNDRFKKIIVEENGVPPLLKLLKDGENADAQNAAASCLLYLADNYEGTSVIVSLGGVSLIAKAIKEAAIGVQIVLVDLVRKMSEVDSDVQEDFGRENVTRPLVSLLGMDVDFDELKEGNTVHNLHSLVEVEKEIMKKGGSGFGGSGSGSRLEANKKEREAESRELKLRLKESCSSALWKLARGSLLNSKKITETKALLVLAKIIEKERGELQTNCLMVVMELAAVAQSNPDLRRVAFKPNMPAAKAVLDQLLRVVNEETSVLQVSTAIKAIGCLARVFPAKETRVIKPLVAQLSHMSCEVATEAAKALAKFVCDDNFNRNEHSKAIIEFNGVPKLMSLIRSNDRGQSHLHELVLLCNLAINIGNSKSLEQARALSMLEGAARYVIAHNPDMRELFGKAIHQLTLFQAGTLTHKQELAM